MFVMDMHWCIEFSRCIMFVVDVVHCCIQVSNVYNVCNGYALMHRGSKGT